MLIVKHLQRIYYFLLLSISLWVAVSLSPQRYDTQPAAIAAGCFRHTADTSSLVDDVWRKQTSGPSGPAAVGHRFARTPREGAEIATAPGRRNLAFSHIVLSPNSRTSTPPMGIQNTPARAPSADIGLWRTATIDITHKRPVPVRLFGEERYRGLLSRSS